MIYNEIKGDLFTCPESDSLAHCISEDCNMGSGIAVKFKENFNGVEELLYQIKEGMYGKVAILKRGDRYIYNLLTKEKSFHLPTYHSLKASLVSMLQHARDNEVKRISMPKIGCGLDRLQWASVKNIISDVFSDTDIEITVYYL